MSKYEKLKKIMEAEIDPERFAAAKLRMDHYDDRLRPIVHEAIEAGERGELLSSMMSMAATVAVACGIPREMFLIGADASFEGSAMELEQLRARQAAEAAIEKAKETT